MSVWGGRNRENNDDQAYLEKRKNGQIFNQRRKEKLIASSFNSRYLPKEILATYVMRSGR